MLGDFDASTTMETLGRNAGSQGYAKACQDVLDIEVQQLEDKRDE